MTAIRTTVACGLGGLILAARGASQAEAQRNIQDAIPLWLDSARAFGDPIPEANGRRLILA